MASCSAIAELPLGGGAEELHDAMSVDDDHGIRHRVENGAEVVFPGSQRLFELLFLIDIEGNAAEMACDTGVVLDQAAAFTDPLTGSRRRADPEGNVEIAAELGNPRELPFGALAIPGFEQRKKQVVADGAVLGDSEKTSCRLGPFQLPGCKVQIPGSDAESFDSEPEMLIAGRIVRWRLNYAGHASVFAFHRSSFTPPAWTIVYFSGCLAKPRAAPSPGHCRNLIYLISRFDPGPRIARHFVATERLNDLRDRHGQSGAGPAERGPSRSGLPDCRTI